VEMQGNFRTYSQPLSNDIPVPLEGDPRLLGWHVSEDMGSILQHAFQHSDVADYAPYGECMLVARYRMLGSVEAHLWRRTYLL
jgi:hypothetical protein